MRLNATNLVLKNGGKVKSRHSEKKNTFYEAANLGKENTTMEDSVYMLIVFQFPRCRMVNKLTLQKLPGKLQK